MLQQPDTESMGLERNIEFFREREDARVILADPLTTHFANQFRSLRKTVRPRPPAGAVAGFEHGDIPPGGAEAIRSRKTGETGANNNAGVTSASRL